MAVEIVTAATVTNADADAARTIYGQNRAELLTYWPGGPTKVPNPTTRGAFNALFLNGLVTIRLDRVAGVVQGFLCTTNARSEEVMALFLRLVDATTSVALTTAERRTLLRTVGVDLLRDWMLACGARRPQPHGLVAYYPAAGHASMIEMLDQMTAVNGVQPDTASRPGWRGYRLTAAQGLAGLAAIVP